MLPSVRLSKFLNQAHPAIREYASLNDPAKKTLTRVGVVADTIYSAISATHGPLSRELTLRQLLTGVPTDGLFDLPGQWRDFGELKQQGHAGYLGLIWALRSLEKVDRHCHISSALHESEIAELMIANPALLEQMLERLEPDNKNPANQKAGEIEAIRRASLAGDEKTLAEHLKEYGPLAEWRNKDFFVVNFDLLAEAVKRAVVRMLSDGVVSLELRLNPVKPELFSAGELSGKSDEDKIRHICQKTMTVVNKAIYEAVADAELDYGVKADPAKIKVLFSFDRSKDYQKPFPSLPEVWRVVEAVLNHLPADPRIAGIDISGMEYSLQDHDPDHWRQAFQLASQQNLLVTTHLGDMSFIMKKQSPVLFNLYKAAKADNAAFVGLFTEHLSFFEGFAGLLPANSRIGHAFTMHPSFLAYAWPILMGEARENWEHIPDLDLDSVIGARVGELRTTFAAKNISIEHCPSAAVSGDCADPSVNTIAHYQHLPVYRWLEQGLKVGLGIDGIWHTGSRPRSLSEELARVIVASSKDLCLRTILGLIS